ncbi:hypothetical protein PLANPX_4894 [Lacipirellula parvula]|uniref:Uncharacterized protein n=1 Tax=Lacipirellula parvula TaxID=2650471 RepID=A0A5K7XGW4_9BACT|nr:hypothetical protein PLANPX_4894 [Lacipirellula parvula]
MRWLEAASGAETPPTYFSTQRVDCCLTDAQRERCHLSMLSVTRVHGVIILDRRGGVCG